MSIYKLMPIVGALALAFAIAPGPSRSGCADDLAPERVRGQRRYPGTVGAIVAATAPSRVGSGARGSDWAPAS